MRRNSFSQRRSPTSTGTCKRCSASFRRSSASERRGGAGYGRRPTDIIASTLYDALDSQVTPLVTSDDQDDFLRAVSPTT